MIPSQKEIAKCYQPLFDLLADEYGINLLICEMDEIRDIVERINERLIEAWRSVCDVQGCNETVTNGGCHWRKSGYWSICSAHSQMARKPQMKPEAINREKNRK